MQCRNINGRWRLQVNASTRAVMATMLQLIGPCGHAGSSTQRLQRITQNMPTICTAHSLRPLPRHARLLPQGDSFRPLPRRPALSQRPWWPAPALRSFAAAVSWVAGSLSWLSSWLSSLLSSLETPQRVPAQLPT
jgi:hypothetical protein